MLPNWLYGKSKSKLASTLGGGGGTPADYEQVKAQVNQNTQDTTALITNLNAHGCKNHLKVNVATYTKNGITITVNADGSVTLNGTCSTGASFGIVSGSAWSMNKGTYRNVAIIDSGTITCPLGKNVYYTSKYGVTQYTVSFASISSKVTKVSPNPFTIANDGDTIDVYFYIDTGVVFNNCTIYPMILDSDYTDYSWSPYAMSNQELTEKVTSDTNLGTAVDLSAYTAYSNMFTAPSDGYVHFQSAASGSTARTIYTYGNNTTAATDPHFTHSTSTNNKAFEVFIKKGLKIYVDGLQTGDTISFYPLT